MKNTLVFSGILLAGCADTTNLVQQAMMAPVQIVFSQETDGRWLALATGGTQASRTNIMVKKVSAKCAQQGLQLAGLTELQSNGSESPLGIEERDHGDMLQARFTCTPYR